MKTLGFPSANCHTGSLDWNVVLIQKQQPLLGDGGQCLRSRVSGQVADNTDSGNTSHPRALLGHGRGKGIL